MSEVPIYFIYDDKCQHCRDAYSVILSAILKSKIPCKIQKFKYDTKAAIGIAMTHGIDDLPGIMVGTGAGVFKGKDYDEERIIEAIRVAAKK
jgi:hypothetical protein